MAENKKRTVIAGAISILLILTSSCFKKEPLRVLLSAGISLQLPSKWEMQSRQTKNEMRITTTVHKKEHQTITAVVLKAGDIPFSRQIQQDRNNLNISKTHTILFEKDYEVFGNPAYLFIVTSVEQGNRYKSKIIMIQKKQYLVYLTLKAKEDLFERAVADFNKMISDIKVSRE